MAGSTVAVSVAVPPVVILTELLSRVTELTGTTASVTVTVHCAFLVGSAADVTVIVAVPAFLAVNAPFDTVTVFASLLVHVTDLLVALAGSTVAVSVAVPPVVILTELLSRVTELTGTTAGTSTVWVYRPIYCEFDPLGRLVYTS